MEKFNKKKQFHLTIYHGKVGPFIHLKNSFWRAIIKYCFFNWPFMKYVEMPVK